MALSNEETGEEYDMNAHVSLPEDLIEKLKNVKNWEEWPCRWTFDEEKMSVVWLWPHCNVHDKPPLVNHDFEMLVPKDHELDSQEIKPEAPQKNDEK